MNEVQYMNVYTYSFQQIPSKKEVSEDIVSPTAKVVNIESSPYDKGFFDGEESKITQQTQQKGFTSTKVVVTRTVTTNNKVITIDGEQVDGEGEGNVAAGEVEEADGELTIPGSDDVRSPRKKKGTKVKKNPSFKDKLVKKFSRKGERPAKVEKAEHGEKANDKAD